MPFQANFPTGALLTISSYLRNQEGGDLWSAIEAAYDLLGYAGWLMKNGFKPLVGSEKPPMTNEEIAAKCEQLAAVCEAGPDPGMSKALPDWLIPMLLKLLEQFLKPKPTQLPA